MDYYVISEWAQRVGLVSLILSLISFVGLWWSSGKISDANDKRIKELSQQTSLVTDYVGAAEHIDSILNPKTIDDLKGEEGVIMLSEDYFLRADQIYPAVRVGKGPIAITGIQVHLVNASQKPLKSISARWHVGEESFVLCAKTAKNGNLVDLTELAVLPHMAQVCIRATWPNEKPGDGISFEELMSKWSPIELILMLDSREYRVHFSKAKLQAYFTKLQDLFDPPQKEAEVQSFADKQGAVWKKKAND